MADPHYEYSEGSIITGAALVRFYVSPIDDQEHIEVKFPGDKYTTLDEVLVGPVRDQYLAKYHAEYDAYLRGEDSIAGQTKLENVPWIDEATVHMVKSANVFTVENLANVSDAALKALGPAGLKLRDKAILHVAEQEELREVEQVRAHNEELERRLAALEAQGHVVPEQTEQATA